MKNEKELIINELTRKNKNKKIRIIVEDEINYYSIYDLVGVFLQPADSKDYFKKSIKNDPIFKNIYKSLVQYKKYNKREITVVNIYTFNIVISFFVSIKLDNLKNYIDQFEKPENELEDIIKLVSENLSNQIQ